MDKDTKKMLVRVLLYDILILILTYMGSILFFEKYKLVIIGVLMAGINFILNAVVTSYTLRVLGKKAFYIIGAMIRISITVGVAVIISNNNINNLVVFLIGYSLHYVAVLLYGATQGIKKGRK